MRKIGIFLALIGFLLCLFLGYQAAQLLTSPAEKQSGDLTSETDSSQSNILIVHVDRLDADSPKLITLWVAFSYQADPASLTFLPLYPAAKAGENDLAGRFSLSKEKEISSSFLEALRKYYSFQWKFIVIIDQKGVEYWAGVLNAGEFAQSFEDGKDTLLKPEIDLLANFCGNLREHGSGVLDGLDWGQITPDHMRTNIPFDQLKDDWDRIQKSGLCDVFSQ
jgi:hypothetical protein